MLIQPFLRRISHKCILIGIINSFEHVPSAVSKYESLDVKATSSAVLALYGCIWRRKYDHCTFSVLNSVSHHTTERARCY